MAKELTEEQKIAKRERNKQYREANRQQLAEKNRHYRKLNPEKVAERQRRCREKNKEKYSEKNRLWREANKEKLRASKRRYYEANKEKLQEGHRLRRKANPEKLASDTRKRAYGTDGLALFDAQQGKCAICNVKITLGKNRARDAACLDHCHETGVVRGWLCGSCNLGIGMLKDSAEILKSAVNYLVLNG